MRIFTATLLAFSLAVLAAEPASADATSDARSAIAALHAASHAAIVKKNADGAVASLAPEFVHTNEKGKRIDAAGFKKTLQALFQVMTSYQGKSTIAELTLNGDTAEAKVTTHVQATMRNPQ